MIISRIPGQQQGRGNRKRKSADVFIVWGKQNFNGGGNTSQQPDVRVVFSNRKFILSGLWSRCVITGGRLGCKNIVEISIRRTGHNTETWRVSPAGIALANLSGYSKPVEIFKYIQVMS